MTYTYTLQVPGTAASASHLAADEIEIGMGIHNEAGNQRISPIPSTATLVNQLLDKILRTDDEDRSFVPFRSNSENKVVVLVNNLGGLSELELSGISKEVSHQLLERGIIIERLLAGTFMASLTD